MDENVLGRISKLSIAFFMVAFATGGPKAWAASEPVDAPSDQFAKFDAGEAKVDDASLSDSATSEAAEDTGDAESDDDGFGDSSAGKFNASYFGIFYGPSLGNPTLYQSSPSGVPDPDKPLLLKNYIGVGYNVTDHIAITPTFYWMYLPTQGNQMLIKDPFVRVSHNQIFHNDNWNVYGDLRFYVPASAESRDNDMRAGFQSFQIVTYDVPDTRVALGNYTSIRYNMYGKNGNGNDMELYVGPNMTYQASNKLALQVLYETTINHSFGDQPFALGHDPMDFEAGLIWDATSSLMLNPYLTYFPEGSLSLRSVGVGMLLSYRLL